MAVKLSEFASRLVLERKLVRANKGPSIVPLMIIRFIGYQPNEEDYYGPRAERLLLTVCQRTASIAGHTDLTKLYSGTPYVGYTEWWNHSWVQSVRPPLAISTHRLLEINVSYRPISNDDDRHRW